MLLADGEAGPYVVVSAVSGDQTKVVFDEIHNSIINHPEIAKSVVCRPSLREIEYPARRGLLKGLSNQGWNKLGRPPHCFIGDEFAFWQDYKPYVAIKTGAGSRKQPLLLTISTSGTDRTTPAYEQWQYAQAVKDSAVVDPTFFPLIYTAEDNIHEPTVWRKANPSIGYSLDIDEIKTWSDRAKRSKIEELQFRTIPAQPVVQQRQPVLESGRLGQVRLYAARPDGKGRRSCTGHQHDDRLDERTCPDPA